MIIFCNISRLCYLLIDMLLRIPYLMQVYLTKESLKGPKNRLLGLHMDQRFFPQLMLLMTSLQFLEVIFAEFDINHTNAIYPLGMSV